MHPDLPHEQAYFDRALALRDRQQAGLARAPAMAANPKAAVELRRRVSGLGLTDPDEAIAFGRIDTDRDRWYIGKGAIWGDDNELVVVNWQAPIAAPFYTATPEQPEGLDSRRVFRCSGNQIREIEDVMFRAVAEAITSGDDPGPVLGDALLEALGSNRSGELGDIVATIQAAQYEVINRDLDQLLVVQGGPGTGKTVVGLHRVSWLLYNRRDRLEPRDVLIVGPNPAFVRYISSVLPSLGEEAVVQLPLRSLGPRVRIGRVDPPAVRRLKGDRRMLRLVLRGLRQRQRIEPVPIELTVDGRRLEVDGRRVATRARQLAGRPHNEAYRMLRAFLVSEVTTALGRSAAPGSSPVVVQGEAAGDIDAYLDRVWPSLTPQGFLVDLLSSRRRLLAAGAGSLSEAELDLLSLPSGSRVSTRQWSVDDVPVLDAADALINGVRATYEHIVVDEAQDLSPLQLESVRRRSRTGSMTVLGDLAQGTGQWAHDSWDAVVAALRHERVTATAVELEYGYRLPAEVHEVAMRLLPEAAPGLACPDALRSSGHEVDVVAVATADDVAAEVVATVGELVGDGIVGVITPASIRPALVAALDAEGVAWAAELAPSAPPVVVLTPDEAKGLEFDVVVAVEPAAIIDESPQGVRALFVAMTRCTNRLALVHARRLPQALGLGPDPGLAGDELTEVAVVPEDPPPVTDPDAPVFAAAGPYAPESVAAYLHVTEPEAGEIDPPEPFTGDLDAREPVAAGQDALDLVAADLQPTEPAAAEIDIREAVAGDVDVRESAVVDHVDPTATPSGPDVAEHDGTDAAEPVDVSAEAEPTDRADTEPDDRVHPAEPERPVPALAAALDDLDRDVARAIAATVAAKLAGLVSPALLPLVADELVRELRAAPPAEGDAPSPAGEATTGSGSTAGSDTPEVRTF